MSCYLVVTRSDDGAEVVTSYRFKYEAHAAARELRRAGANVAVYERGFAEKFGLVESEAMTIPIDSVWIACCAKCGHMLEVSNGRAKPKRSHSSARCLMHPKAIVSCARFVRAAVVVELVQAIGEL